MDYIKQHFEKQLIEQQETKFNIFSALHNMNDEERLHSRFIAYLLRQDANHGKGNEFLKLFVHSVLQIDNFNCENCTVVTEYKDIDILVYNNKQAIIIENKIYANDSNHLNRCDEYRGQLERYYNTIKKGIDKDGKSGIKREEVFTVYLTLGGNPPSLDSLGKTLSLNDVLCRDYTNDIRAWLTNCISITEQENDLLAKTILQYKELITKLTSNVNQAKENQKMISENIEDTWELQSKEEFFTEKCKDIFKHVKWHTVADFINELDKTLIEKGANIIEKPNLNDITKVTHNENNNANTKIIIRFEYKGALLQIVNDTKGFTLGNLTTERWKWDYFSNKIKNIKFSDFSKKETFEMTNSTKRKEIIKKIVEEVMERYDNLEKTF